MVVDHDHKILLVDGFSRGWEFPGGYVNSGESIKDAAIREVKEESGIDISLIKTLGFEHDITRSKMVVVLKGKPKGGELTVSVENKAVGFYHYGEANSKIRLKNFRERLERCFNEKDTPYFVEI